jgi:glycosyltransferase involved in cell wall biosynthesis
VEKKFAEGVTISTLFFMHITLVHEGVLPASHYGGTERVVWYLGKELVKMGHRVSFLANKGSLCNWAPMHMIDPSRPIYQQIPPNTDIVHASTLLELPTDIAAVYTVHGNPGQAKLLPNNAVFVSKNHAKRYDSESYVHNGLDWADYGEPDFEQPRTYFHFLGKAAWRVKNVQGAIDLITATPREKLYVLGGHRLNLSMGFRFTLSPRVRFFGMVSGAQKLQLLRQSKGLIFPVLWHEPFGLAIIESLYFGAPVFGLPNGSLPELVPQTVGLLSNQSDKLLEAILNADVYNKEHCHQYAASHFSSKRMAERYLEKYQSVLDGKFLNKNAPKWVEFDLPTSLQ